MPESTIPLVGSLAIKTTIQGSLIYLTMMLYVVALFFTLLKKQRLASSIFFTGFVVSAVSVAFRWLSC